MCHWQGNKNFGLAASSVFSSKITQGELPSPWQLAT
jgi:hypothetical protein